MAVREVATEREEMKMRLFGWRHGALLGPALGLIALAPSGVVAATAPTIIGTGVGGVDNSYYAYPGSPLPAAGGGCGSVSPAFHFAGAGSFVDVSDNVFFPAATFVVGTTGLVNEVGCATYESELATTSSVELDMFGVPGGHLLCGLQGNISRSLFHITMDFTTNPFGCSINGGPTFSPITVHIDGTVVPTTSGDGPLGPITAWTLAGTMIVTTIV